MIGLAATGLAAIVFATLCPIGLRPHVASPNLERFVAYMALGGLVARACGRRALGATALVLLAAIGLEAAQALVPGRHAALSDAVVKSLGGVLGCAAAQVAYPIRRLFNPPARSARGTGRDDADLSPAQS